MVVVHKPPWFPNASTVLAASGMDACTNPPAPVCAITSTLRGCRGFAPGVVGNAAIMASTAACGAGNGVEFPTGLNVPDLPGLTVGGGGSTLLTPATIWGWVRVPEWLVFHAVNQELKPDSSSDR